MLFVINFHCCSIFTIVSFIVSIKHVPDDVQTGRVSLLVVHSSLRYLDTPQPPPITCFQAFLTPHHLTRWLLSSSAGGGASACARSRSSSPLGTGVEVGGSLGDRS